MPGGQGPAPPELPVLPVHHPGVQSQRCWASMGHPCRQRGCAPPAPILCPVPWGVWRCRGISCPPPRPKPLCPSRQPQIFFLKMFLVALPSIFVSWPRPLHPPSPLTAWVGLLRGFPLSQRSPPSLPTRINLSKKKKRPVKAISGRARASRLPSVALGAGSGENFQLQRETLCLAMAETWEEKADCKGGGVAGDAGVHPGVRHSSGEGCWNSSLHFRCETIGVWGLMALMRGVQRRETGPQYGFSRAMRDAVRCSLQTVAWGIGAHHCTGIAPIASANERREGARVQGAPWGTPRAPQPLSPAAPEPLSLQLSAGKCGVSRLNTWISGTPTLFKAGEGRKLAPSLTVGSWSGVPLPPMHHKATPRPGQDSGSQGWKTKRTYRVGAFWGCKAELLTLPSPTLRPELPPASGSRMLPSQARV